MKDDGGELEKEGKRGLSGEGVNEGKEVMRGGGESEQSE